jgi:hypothetical protein
MSKSSVAVDFFRPGRAKDLSAPLYIHGLMRGRFFDDFGG